MARVTISQLAETLARLQEQIAEVSRRLGKLESQAAPEANAVEAEIPAAAAPPPPVPVDAAVPEPAPTAAPITEEELIAISAVLGAYFGVRVHIRQIRLVSTRAWSQQGRVSIQASHRLQ